MLNYIVEYTTDLPEGANGRCEYPTNPLGDCIIKIHPDYIDDAGLLAHEVEHFKQWRRLNVLHIALYKYSKMYRLWAEFQAYKVQGSDIAIKRLWTYYDL